MAQCLSALGGERRVARQEELGLVTRGTDELAVRLDAGDAEARHAGLPRAEDVAFAAQPEVFLGDAKAVLGLAHDVEARFRGFAQRPPIEQQAGGMLADAPDAPAQLMQLRKPEAYGVLGHHDDRLRL